MSIRKNSILNLTVEIITTGGEGFGEYRNKKP
jgi:hypothetical protein